MTPDECELWLAMMAVGMLGCVALWLLFDAALRYRDEDERRSREADR